MCVVGPSRGRAAAAERGRPGFHIQNCISNAEIGAVDSRAASIDCRRSWAPKFRKAERFFKSPKVAVAPSPPFRSRQPPEQSSRVRSLLVSAMSACCPESTSAARERKQVLPANGPTFDPMVLSAQARHTARLGGKYETECPLYGQEGSKRSEGRAVRPTWRTLKICSQINALAFRGWGELPGDIMYPPAVSPPTGEHRSICVR